MSNNAPRKLSHAELVACLRQWADGTYGTEAAVDLLAAHDVWLERGEFRRAIWTDRCRADGRVWAGIDWDAAAVVAAESPASTSERAILSLAISLADGAHVVSLSDALWSLDDRNTELVLNAVAHACGVHRQRSSLVVNGRIV